MGILVVIGLAFVLLFIGGFFVYFLRSSLNTADSKSIDPSLKMKIPLMKKTDKRRDGVQKRMPSLLIKLLAGEKVSIPREEIVPIIRSPTFHLLPFYIRKAGKPYSLSFCSASVFILDQAMQLSLLHNHADTLIMR